MSEERITRYVLDWLELLSYRPAHGHHTHSQIPIISTIKTGNIPGAFNVPSESFQDKCIELIEELKHKKNVVFHCAMSQGIAFQV